MLLTRTLTRRGASSALATACRCRCFSTKQPPIPPKTPIMPKSRRILLTAAVALITVTGAVTGASMKIDREVVKQRQEVVELTPDERIEMLQSRRAVLVAMKIPLERKLVDLRERMLHAEADTKRKEGRA